MRCNQVIRQVCISTPPWDSDASLFARSSPHPLPHSPRPLIPQRTSTVFLLAAVSPLRPTAPSVHSREGGSRRDLSSATRTMDRRSQRLLANSLQRGALIGHCYSMRTRTRLICSPHIGGCDECDTKTSPTLYFFLHCSCTKKLHGPWETHLLPDACVGKEGTHKGRDNAQQGALLIVLM